MQYAYTRIRSIERKAQELAIDSGSDAEIRLEAPQEKALALKLLQFSDTVEQVAQDAMPHSLCTYLYDLASLFMSFTRPAPY